MHSEHCARAHQSDDCNGARFALSQWCEIYFKELTPRFSLESHADAEHAADAAIPYSIQSNKHTMWPKLSRKKIRRAEMLSLLAVADRAEGSEVLDGLIDRIKDTRSGGDGGLGPYELLPIHLAAFRGEARCMCMWLKLDLLAVSQSLSLSWLRPLSD